jgi:hypothetical protein
MKAFLAVMLAASFCPVGAAPVAAPDAAPSATVATIPAGAVTSAASALQPVSTSTLQPPSASTLQPSAALATDPQVGQPEATVYTMLGQPAGRIDMPDQVILLFGRGDVILRNGLVSEVKLLDQAAYAARVAEDAVRQAQLEQENARLAALRKSFLTDPHYLALPIRERLLAIDRFDRENPGSGIHQDYLALLAIYQDEIASQQRLDILETRLAAAEQEANAAAQAAAVAQQQAAAAQQQVAAEQPVAPSQQTSTTVTQASNQNVNLFTGTVALSPAPSWAPRTIYGPGFTRRRQPVVIFSSNTTQNSSGNFTQTQDDAPGRNFIRVGSPDSVLQPIIISPIALHLDQT